MKIDIKQLEIAFRKFTFGIMPGEIEWTEEDDEAIKFVREAIQFILQGYTEKR